MKSIKCFLAATAAILLLPFAQANATVIDAAGDFLASYTGPHNGDMDVLSADVFFDIVNHNFILTATLNGAIGTTANGAYVFGFDTGGVTIAPFAGIGEGNVIFNKVVVVNGTTGAINTGGFATISGNSLTAVVATTALTSTGRAFSDYLWNLWPRVLAGGGAQPISDFAPNNAMVNVSVPEPASLTLVALGFIAIAFARRRSFKRLTI
jgi:hypothetical protein